MRTRTAATLALAFVTSLPAASATRGGYGLSVLVDGSERPELRKGGTVYVEALKGREYALRVTNPLGVRVGVALAVDGLNTIDASRRDAASAVKWVLEPYQTIVLEGWQVSSSDARRFVFTGERDSYGAALGKTEDLGVIEAVFYPERVRRPVPAQPIARDGRDASRPSPGAPPAPRPKGEGVGDRAEAEKSAASALSDEYAATGMGDRTRHEVIRIDLELERTPAARIRIRYEFRPQLVRLGLLPPDEDRLARRERARGFDRYCPEPGY